MPEESKSGSETLTSMLGSRSKDELLQIILNLSEEDSDIEKKLLSRYSPPNENELSESRKLIRDYINQTKQRGFIPRSQLHHALTGARLTLEKAQLRFEEGQIERAVSLAILVMSISMSMFDYSDDSNGDLGNVIRWSLALIEEAVSAYEESGDEQEKKSVFSSLFKEAIHKRYDGWEDFRFDILKNCIPLTSDEKLRKKIEDQLEAYLKNLEKDSWNSQYQRSEIKQLQLAILEYHHETEKAEKFIQENLSYSEFREKAIQDLLDKKEFTKVLRLSEEGEEIDKDKPGLVTKWKTYQLKAYEGLGDLEKQRSIMLELLLQGDFKFYVPLKKTYQPSEWEAVLNNLLDQMEKKQSREDTYLSILTEENLTEKLLDYCQKSLISITHLYPLLLESHFEEAAQIYRKYIEDLSEDTGDRRKYKGIAKQIKIYKENFGVPQAKKLVDDLKERYKRRPSFIQELDKLKI